MLEVVSDAATNLSSVGRFFLKKSSFLLTIPNRFRCRTSLVE
jgi:hypothetical protein